MGKVIELGIVGFVVFIFVLVVGDVVHKPIIADRVQHQNIIPAAHAK